LVDAFDEVDIDVFLIGEHGRDSRVLPVGAAGEQGPPNT
jgi:hypothetical protein